MPPRPTMPDLVRELLRYSCANPNASDSAEGIARWWLDAPAGVDMQALEEALAFLVARGAYAERLAADGRRRYRRICSDSMLQLLLAQSRGAFGGAGKAPAAGGKHP